MRRMDNSSSGKDDNIWIKPDMPLCGARMCKEKDENIMIERIIEIKEKIAQGGQFLHSRTTMGQNQIVLLISPWAAP